jgi:hypothetical protein
MTVHGRVRSLHVPRRTSFNRNKTKNICVPADQIEFPRDDPASENYAPPITPPRLDGRKYAYSSPCVPERWCHGL